MSQQDDPQFLVAILQLAYSGELAAAYAYRGHWHSLSDADERTQIEKIEKEEWHHRKLVGEMLRGLNSKPSTFREVRDAIIGRVLGLLCHFTGWLAPMYGAGKLESRNIREYETAARHARDCGRNDFVDCLLTNSYWFILKLARFHPLLQRGLRVHIAGTELKLRVNERVEPKTNSTVLDGRVGLSAKH